MKQGEEREVTSKLKHFVSSIAAARNARMHVVVNYVIGLKKTVEVTVILQLRQ